MNETRMRLAELLGGVSLASDLANGFPPGKVLRTVVLAVEVGRRAGIDAGTLRDAYYTTLLRFLGCTGFAHEEAHEFGAGDDIAVRSVMAMADVADPVGTVSAIVRGVGRGAPLLSRGAAVARLLHPDAARRHASAQCDTSERLASLVGLSPAVRHALHFVCERWDGRGFPEQAHGEEL